MITLAVKGVYDLGAEEEVINFAQVGEGHTEKK
jgi:hypothetical protein